MKKIIIVCLILMLPFLHLSRPVSAERLEQKIPDTQIESKQLSDKAQILAQYLENYNSPLQYHAQDFIDAATVYGLDWKLLPSIAGVESTFGKQIPGGYNAWGWGVYGTQAVYFNSWREGIFTIAKGLRENYLNKGLTDPYAINTVYAASPVWGGKVSYFMQDLANFADKYQSEQQKTANVNITPHIAAVSGQLAFRL